MPDDIKTQRRCAESIRLIQLSLLWPIRFLPIERPFWVIFDNCDDLRLGSMPGPWRKLRLHAVILEGQLLPFSFTSRTYDLCGSLSKLSFMSELHGRPFGLIASCPLDVMTPHWISYI